MRVNDRESISTVWLEVQIDSDGIGLSLISESPDSVGAVVENVEYLTFDELESREGDLFTMNLSDNADEILSEQRKDASVHRLMQSDNLSDKSEILPENPESEELLAYMGLLGGEVEDGSPDLPEVGDVVFDGRPPSWSQDNRLEVVGISDKSADEYVVQESVIGPDETVADANPSADPDEPVVKAEYLSGNSKTYAFPLSRLEIAGRQSDGL